MKIRRFLCGLLTAVLLAVCMFPGSAVTVSAEETSDDTDKLESQKKSAESKISSLKSELNTVKNRISELEENVSDLTSYIAELDEQASELARQVDELNEQIDDKKEEIAQTEDELSEAEAVSEKQYEDMKKRIQYMYENGTPSMLELILTSADMADFLNRSSYAAQLTEYDHNMLEEYIEQKNEIERQKAELEEEKEELDQMLETAQDQEDTVNSLIASKKKQLESYQAEIDSQNNLAAGTEADLAEQEKLLNQIEAQIAAAAAASNSDSDGDGGASGLVWPCPSSHTISSYFGPRAQPMPGASTNHQGIDIAASGGAAIVAAAAGRVTTATYSSSAGNYITISHGGGLSTTYMHCSALYVSVGESVSQGQKIAAVGSTGFSTGNHLHFGVIKNGSYVNPLNYVS